MLELHLRSTALTGPCELVYYPRGPELIDELEYSLDIKVEFEHLEC